MTIDIYHIDENKVFNKDKNLLVNIRKNHNVEAVGIAIKSRMYNKVATVDCNDLQEALSLMKNKNFATNWNDDGKATILSEGERTINCGDIVIKDNNAYVIFEGDFEKLNSKFYDTLMIPTSLFGLR